MPGGVGPSGGVRTVGGRATSHRSVGDLQGRKVRRSLVQCVQGRVCDKL